MSNDKAQITNECLMSILKKKTGGEEELMSFFVSLSFHLDFGF